MLKSEARDVSNKLFVYILACLLLSSLQVSYAQEISTSSVLKDSSDYARKLVRGMIKAHGGLKSWMDKPVMKFNNEEYSFLMPSSHTGSFESVDIYHYTIAIQPRNSIGHAFLTEDKGAYIYFDGTDIWTIGLTEENNNLNKSPVILLFSTYSLISLPWLLQMENVILKHMGTKALPLEGRNCEVVRMSFTSKHRNQHSGYYELYIDPETNLLSGVKQTAVLPILPGTEFKLGVPLLPTPIFHVFKSYDLVENLKIPSSFVTYTKGKLLGMNFIQRISLNGDFERTLINLPHREMITNKVNQY